MSEIKEVKRHKKIKSREGGGKFSTHGVTFSDEHNSWMLITSPFGISWLSPKELRDIAKYLEHLNKKAGGF